MSMPDMILIREINGIPADRGIFMTSRNTPSIRYRTTTPPSPGSIWTSLARLVIPSARRVSTSLTIGRARA